MSRSSAGRDAAGLAALLLLLLAVGLARPLLPIDETRYAAVAWEMQGAGLCIDAAPQGTVTVHKLYSNEVLTARTT